MNFLDFEQPIAELEAKIEELRYVGNDQELDINAEIERLQKRSRELTESIFARLSAWQVAQIARHPQRPYTLDYIERIFTDFEELHGERHSADDAAIICGIGRLEAGAVAIIGHQKGRDTRERLRRNYGMPRPEGYRKALRVMRLAERFRLPVLTFIDTVIGEGGSGGALAIGVGDRSLMLQYSIYAVISPEGCASILWKNPDKAREAAEAMGITAARLSELGLINRVIDEPLGGAHRDFDDISARLKTALAEELEQLQHIPLPELLAQRQARLRGIGRFKAR